MYSCSMLTNTGRYPTIPLSTKAKNTNNATVSNPLNKTNNIESASLGNTSTTRQIEEERVNGQLVKIKVDNSHHVPDYYIYPSQQQKLNTNSSPDKNLATPSWQINW